MLLWGKEVRVMTSIFWGLHPTSSLSFWLRGLVLLTFEGCIVSGIYSELGQIVSTFSESQRGIAGKRFPIFHVDDDNHIIVEVQVLALPQEK